MPICSGNGSMAGGATAPERGLQFPAPALVERFLYSEGRVGTAEDTACAIQGLETRLHFGFSGAPISPMLIQACRPHCTTERCLRACGRWLRVVEKHWRLPRLIEHCPRAPDSIDWMLRIMGTVQCARYAALAVLQLLFIIPFRCGSGPADPHRIVACLQHCHNFLGCSNPSAHNQRTI